MNQQLCLFPEAQQPLKEALSIFQGCSVHHEHYNKFISSICAAVKTSQAGSTLVAACPLEQGLDGIIADLKEQIMASQKLSFGETDFTVIEIRAPSALSSKSTRVELFDRYRLALHSTRICHRGQPRFLETGAPIATRSDFGQLAEFLKFKNPSLVIVRDVQNLARSGAPESEAIALWRMLIDIASQSGVPHLLCGTVSHTLAMLQDPCLLDSVHAHVLRRYDITEEADRNVFKETLNDYDRSLPWAGNDRLATKIKFIDARVHGDPDRVHRWVIRGLTYAAADGASKLTWAHIAATAPAWHQVKLAEEESIAIAKFFEPTDGDSVEKETDTVHDEKNKTRPKPGVRKQTRDHVAA